MNHTLPALQQSIDAVVRKAIQSKTVTRRKGGLVNFSHVAWVTVDEVIAYLKEKKWRATYVPKKEHSQPDETTRLYDDKSGFTTMHYFALQSTIKQSVEV